MEEDKSLVEVKNNRKGIRKIINNVVELIKSKVNKDYVLSENSPEFLKRNKDLILKTIRKDYRYLDQVPEDILLKELQYNLVDLYNHRSLPINGIIYTAFKNGYRLTASPYGTPSQAILLGVNAKVAILQYIEMQKENSKGDTVLSNILEYLDESLLLDVDFKKQLLDLAVAKGYKITEYSRPYLKQNSILAENYYRELLENNNVDGLLNANILSPELIGDKNFLQNYINMLSQKGIDTDTIVSTLTHNKECISVFKTDIELFQSVFEQITPSNLEKFFEKFFSDKEVKEIFTNLNQLSGKLLHLSRLYAKDSTILQSLNGDLLGERYKDIPNYKMQLIAKNPKFQSKILGLNDYEYSLYSKMTQLVSQKTARWNRFDKNIVENLSDGYYGELITDLYEQAKQGNKITTKDLETLTFLLSKDCSSKSFFDGYLTDMYKSQGMDENAIKQEEIAYSNNIFNITNKNELEHFEEIKELVCDTILTNPSLDDEQLTTPISKYLEKFKQLPELDRMKLALLEKYYNMDLREAANIINKFSADIDNIHANDEYQASIVEQIKAIKNIFESNDMDTLSQVGSLDILIETDLSSSTYLIEQTKEMFEKVYKEDLYMPKQEDKIGTTTFNGKNIEVFDANTDFSMIVKRITINDGNSQEIWNGMTKDGEDGRKDLRYYTCCSYMTDENILKQDNDIEVILGFAQGTNNYSFDAIYPHDAQTPFYGGDSIYNDLNSSYMLPSTLETNTDDNYNEVVINTLGIDEQGQMTKLQPDYIIYIKEKKDIKDLDNDPVWKKSQKVAGEFGIPIVIVDKEKIKESEKSKIASMSDALKGKPSSNEVLRFVKKVEHYISRYGTEGILEYAPEEKMDFLRQYIEQKQLEEKENTSIPNIDTVPINREQTTDNRQTILRRQAKLKKENIITGEDER